MARKSLFRFWWSNLILRSVNVVPVNLEGSSLSTLKMVLRLLSEGKPVVVFPEGTRSRDGRLLDPQPGIGWLTLKSGAPVVPARIWGTEVALPRSGRGRRARLEVKFGLPLYFDACPDRKAASERVAADIMAAIAALEPASGLG
jgi:1-acyl-sn-glycerol-3-phosphate acyltransferase